MERIAVVDDDPGVRRIVERLLTAQGYETVPLGSGAELRSQVAAGGLALVVLDLGLGDEDGLVLARELRVNHSVPILMLTGHDTVFDKVAGLEAGADDYLTKPFDGHELVARVRALLRRAAALGGASTATAWRFAGWVLREPEREVEAPDGSRVALTAHEFTLLATLARACGRVVDRDALSQATRGHDEAPGDRNLDVLIVRLRAKLAAHGGGDLIKTHRGKGYLLAAVVEPEALSA